MNNNFLKLKKENEKDDSLIINDDLFEQKDFESDDDQIILNEQNDGECSFFSDNSENDLNKFKIISSNINLQNNKEKINENKITKNENIVNINKDKINNENCVKNNEIRNKEEINKKKDFINNNKKNNNDIIDEIKINNENILNKENNVKICEQKNIKANNNKTNNEQPKAKLNNNESKSQTKPKNYFNKKVLYKKNQFNPNNNINKENKTSTAFHNNINETELKDKEKDISSNKKFDKKPLTEKRQKSNRSYINKMKEKKNMKINYNNHDKIWKNTSRNEEGSKLYSATDKNNIVPGTEISFDKYGNKTVIKKRMKNINELSAVSKTNHKLIKIEKKLNKSYDNNLVKSSSAKSNSPKINHKKINYSNNINVNKSTGFTRKNKIKNNSKENNNERNTDNLKKVLMNKIDKQISEIIKGKEKMFFNENNKLFFLGFCDILFELGFLHIKETEINDITKIKSHINELRTQPFTNRKFLSENFLFNEQKLLICAWKTILNNFILIKEFDSLPQELEEITLDDCKLFIYIITGLFIGFNQKSFNENNKIISEKNVKNKSLSNFRKVESNKDIIHNVKLNQSYTKSSSNKNSKYHFRKKSDMKDSSNTESNNSNRSSKENILKTILDSRQKSDYNFKSILKIKNFFTYFSELRKLYNLYKKELKEINKRISTEKDLTFKPKTNRNNKILLDKISPKMDFFQRNDLLKKRNEKKIITLQRERSQKLLKECTFEPCKSSKKKENINPKEIVNRLYNNINNPNKLYKSANLNLNLSPYSPCERGEKIFYEKKSQEIFNYVPNINKNFNREMFNNSPLIQDELLNKRIKDLRNANLERLINNYEKNTRGILSDDIKKDKNLIKQIIEADKGNMKLDMEKRTNKDTFDNFQNFNFYNMPNYNYYFNQNEKIIQEPLFTVEIKIKQNIKTIEVYQDDVPEKLAYDFCIENSLGTGSYEKIVNIIKSKLIEIYNGNFNEDIINNEHIEEDNKSNSKVNKEKIHEIINQNNNNNNEINEDKEDLNLDIDLNLNDNNINIEKENENNNNINDEYIDNIKEERNISIEQIKEEIKEEEKLNQIKDENNINENKSE